MAERGRLPDHRVVFSLASIGLLGVLYVVDRLEHYFPRKDTPVSMDPLSRDINYSSSRATELLSRDYQLEKK